MLEIIQDNRSGHRLELVVPTFNEEKRIGNILRYYGDTFDVVLLDDGSSDRTVPMAFEAGATVFRRIGQAIGDAHFVYYANEVTKSGLCFYLFADEFIGKSDLETVYQELRDRRSLVLVRKVEWFYCKRMITFNHTERRGFRKGCARHDPDNLHENLKAIDLPSEQICERLFELHHLQIWSVRGRFGKAGIYGHIEVEQLRRAKHPFWRFFRRYAQVLHNHKANRKNSLKNRTFPTA
jgi:glycosyltransferase involved in cell wall biosynthesis